MKVSESVPGSAPIAPMPLAVASILRKGKIHPGAQEHIRSGAPLGSAVQTTALRCSSGYCGLKYLIWWGRGEINNQRLSFRAVTAGLWGSSAPGKAELHSSGRSGGSCHWSAALCFDPLLSYSR